MSSAVRRARHQSHDSQTTARALRPETVLHRIPQRPDESVREASDGCEGQTPSDCHPGASTHAIPASVLLLTNPAETKPLTARF